MRTIVLLLLLANLTMFGYILLDSRGSGEAVLLSQQVQPENIAIFKPQEFEALDLARLASLPSVCLEWGPFSDEHRERAIDDVERLRLGRSLVPRRAGPDGPTFIVVRDPQQATVARLKNLQGRYAGTALKAGACPTT